MPHRYVRCWWGRDLWYRKWPLCHSANCTTTIPHASFILTLIKKKRNGIQFLHFKVSTTESLESLNRSSSWEYQHQTKPAKTCCKNFRLDVLAEGEKVFSSSQAASFLSPETKCWELSFINPEEVPDTFSTFFGSIVSVIFGIPTPFRSCCKLRWNFRGKSTNFSLTIELEPENEPEDVLSMCVSC